MGRDPALCRSKPAYRHFNPRAPCGARHPASRAPTGRRRFQSTRPVWGATCWAEALNLYFSGFQSTRPVWGATIGSTLCRRRGRYFNPRAPCGARQPETEVLAVCVRFQSTRPVWGATIKMDSHAGQLRNFNPRAPCGARRSKTALYLSSQYFNPRAPCGARLGEDIDNCPKNIFQSTRPVWGATSVLGRSPYRVTDFNPRAPCGARRKYAKCAVKYKDISIHAPRVGRDTASLNPRPK